MYLITDLSILAENKRDLEHQLDVYWSEYGVEECIISIDGNYVSCEITYGNHNQTHYYDIEEVNNAN